MFMSCVSACSFYHLYLLWDLVARGLFFVQLATSKHDRLYSSMKNMYIHCKITSQRSIITQTGKASASAHVKAAAHGGQGRRRQTRDLGTNQARGNDRETDDPRTPQLHGDEVSSLSSPT